MADDPNTSLAIAEDMLEKAWASAFLMPREIFAKVLPGRIFQCGGAVTAIFRRIK